MKKTAISNLDVLRIRDTASDRVFYGCDQEWFTTDWQRRAGCGPSVASNIMIYLNKRDSAARAEEKSQCAEFMENVWRYVTPTEHGMPTTKLLCDSLYSYGASTGRRLACFSFDVPQDTSARTSFDDVARFLETALSCDVPVAFLNLCNGAETNLDRWHWVTIIALEHDDQGRAVVKFLDEGEIKRINLANWYKTTTMGGGFAYFVPPEQSARVVA